MPEVILTEESQMNPIQTFQEAVNNELASHIIGNHPEVDLKDEAEAERAKIAKALSNAAADLVDGLAGEMAKKLQERKWEKSEDFNKTTIMEELDACQCYVSDLYSKAEELRAK